MTECSSLGCTDNILGILDALIGLVLALSSLCYFIFITVDAPCKNLEILDAFIGSYKKGNSFIWFVRGTQE